jgi:hypothetical protein
VHVTAGKGGRDLPGMMVGVDRDPLHVRSDPVQGQVEQRPAADRAERLGPYVGERAQPGAGAGREHHPDETRHQPMLSAAAGMPGGGAGVQRACQP